MFMFASHSQLEMFYEKWYCFVGFAFMVCTSDLGLSDFDYWVLFDGKLTFFKKKKIKLVR